MENKELSIQEIFQKARPFVLMVKKNIALLALFFLVFAFFGVFLAPSPTYTAEAKLLPKASGGGGYSGILSLASAYGIGEEEGLSVEKFQGIASSESILKNSLDHVVLVQEESNTVLYHLINEMGLIEDWTKEHPTWLKLDYSKKGRSQDSVYKELIPVLRKMITVRETRDELILVEVTSKDESFSIAVNNIIVDAVLDFFEKSSISDDKRTKRILELRLDSLKEDLFATEQKLASLKDHSFQTVKTKGLIEILRVERKLRILNEMYIEALKQMELVNFKILSSSVSLDIVDRPFGPIEKDKNSKYKAGILYGIFGFIAGIISIISYKNRRAFFKYFKE